MDLISQYRMVWHNRALMVCMARDSSMDYV